MANAMNVGYNARVRLDNREAVSLPRRSRCREIVCIDGVIWVTFPGDPHDYVLKKGERILAEGNTEAVISGIGKSEFSLITDDGARAGSLLQGLKGTYAT
jgi:hypothetical protein